MTEETKKILGPLAGLVGTWKGDKGNDISPEPDGTEENPYYETIKFEAVGDLTNAEEQVLAVVRYLQIVCRKSNNEVFHDETGYWMWCAQSGEIMQSFAIPRGVAVVAHGELAYPNAEELVFKVSAAQEESDRCMSQTKFMWQKAKTLGFDHTMTLKGDTLSYQETTLLEIYGRQFEHTDQNVLTRV